ncbi:MAG: ion channel [Bacteroidota bacterium]
MHHKIPLMMQEMYKNRFYIFLATQIAILFGSLFFPVQLFEVTIQPVLLMLNIGAGILLISSNKRLTWFFIILFAASAVVFGSVMLTRTHQDTFFLRLPIYFIFYTVVTFNIIRQVWWANFVNQNVVMGLISGYISLGLLGFFLFMSIELAHPGAFQGNLLDSDQLEIRTDAMMYYAYITLLTIGYGEIVPVVPVAQKAAILVGLIGQFYMVIITAVVIEKYIRHSKRE